MTNYYMRKLGKACQQFRLSETKYSQSDVAKDLKYDVKNISAFENGRNRNIQILAWYIENGFNYNDWSDKYGKGEEDL